MEMDSEVQEPTCAAVPDSSLPPNGHTLEKQSDDAARISALEEENRWLKERVASLEVKLAIPQY